MNMIVTNTPPTEPDSISPLPFDFATRAGQYTLDNETRDALLKIEKAIFDRIKSYDPAYGPYMTDHLEWTSNELKDFLIFKGYDEDTVEKLHIAFKIHDCGKTLQPGLWRITAEKQERTEEENRLRPLHGPFGETVIKNEAAKLQMNDNLRSAIQAASAFAALHHERLDGSGPLGVKAKDICEILRAAAIVDTIHGKFKAKNMDAIMRDMTGEKHKGQFDEVLIHDYARFKGISLDAKTNPAFQPAP